MKNFVLTISVLFVTVSAARAQFGSGTVYDPIQSVHAIEQIAQGENVISNAIATYNLAHQMAMSPQTLYQPFLSPSTYWRALNQAENTYGNSQPYMDTVNTGINAQYAYQQAGISGTNMIPQFSSLSTSGQQPRRHP
jgi:hypothetical protein